MSRGTRLTVDPQDMIATLLALAAMPRRRPRKSLKVLERERKVRRREARAKSIAASDRRIAAQRAARRPQPAFGVGLPFGTRIADRIVLAMRPGLWYGGPDIERAAGLNRAERGKIHQALLPAGLVERRRNPNGRRRTYGDIGEPIWLYRLSELGELTREALVLIAS